MNGFNFSEFLQKKFDEGKKLHQDQTYIQKRECLLNNNIPLEETDIKNVNKVRLDKKVVFIQLLTKEEDPSEKLIKTRSIDSEQWTEMDISFFISLYKSSQLSHSLDVIEWLKSNEISFLKVPDHDFVKCKPPNYAELLIPTSCENIGRIPVKYKLYEKDYYFTKERLLDILKGTDAPKNYNKSTSTSTKLYLKKSL